MILFIDDERRYSSRYIEELKRQGLEVIYQDNVDDAILFLEEAAPGEVEAVVLDIMMPPGAIFSEEETRDGLDTGIYLFERVRKLLPELPIVILTNVSEEQVARRFEAEANCWFRRKLNCLPEELAELVREASQSEAIM